MYIIARADLNLSKGKLAAQAAHAAVSATLTARKVKARLVERWLASGGRKICVTARHLDHLKRLYGEARADGLVAEMITDAGHTEIPAGTITVVAVGPAPERSLEALLGGLPLLR